MAPDCIPAEWAYTADFWRHPTPEPPPQRTPATVALVSILGLGVTAWLAWLLIVAMARAAAGL